jgi:hypothetical protein
MSDCKHEYILVTTIRKEKDVKKLFNHTIEKEDRAILQCTKCKDNKTIGFNEELCQQNAS